MKEQELSKAAMARRMGTSRSSLDRLLDSEVPSVTLLTLEKAAHVLGKRVRIEMVDAAAG
jgi:transcriptional regulator with XRE-family HTH domain